MESSPFLCGTLSIKVWILFVWTMTVMTPAISIFQIFFMWFWKGLLTSFLKGGVLLQHGEEPKKCTPFMSLKYWNVARHSHFEERGCNEEQPRSFRNYILPGKTNEWLAGTNNHEWVDVSPVKNGDFPLSFGYRSHTYRASSSWLKDSCCFDPTLTCFDWVILLKRGGRASSAAKHPCVFEFFMSWPK